MENCIFCKIVNNEIPSYKVYEDDLVFAFLDINPVSKGHVLVVPKKHFKDIFEIEEKYLERIVIVGQKIAKKMKDVLGIDGANLFQASGACAEQSVFHFHLHVIPRSESDSLHFSHVALGDISEEEFKEVATKLKIEA